MGLPQGQGSWINYSRSEPCSAAKAAHSCPLWSEADEATLRGFVRFTPQSGHSSPTSACPLCATSCREQPQQSECIEGAYSISSSARSRNDSGMASPSALAVVRLIAKSHLVGCSTGNSATFVPRRILSTNSPARRNSAGRFGPHPCTQRQGADANPVGIDERVADNVERLACLV